MTELDLEAWELFAREHGDDAELSGVTCREWIDLHRRLRAAERDEDRQGFDERSQALAREIERAEQAERERDEARNGKAGIDDILQTLHAQVAEMCAFAGASPDAPQDSWTLRDRLVALVRERDEARARTDQIMAECDAHRRVATRQLEAAEARVAELEARDLGCSCDCPWPCPVHETETALRGRVATLSAENAALRAVAAEARIVAERHPYYGRLVDALAALPKTGERDEARLKLHATVRDLADSLRDVAEARARVKELERDLEEERAAARSDTGETWEDECSAARMQRDLARAENAALRAVAELAEALLASKDVHDKILSVETEWRVAVLRNALAALPKGGG